MIALLQRVVAASVTTGGCEIAVIDEGLLVFVGFEKDDDEASVDRMIERVVSYRVFADDAGFMNRSLIDTGGGMLMVPQFTLAADTRRGRRPSFHPAAPPEVGRRLFEYACRRASSAVDTSAFGEFGADMQVHLTNDGPVTLWLQS